ncbi:hypothetical protein [Occultella gossypii]|uniref:Uncharacterized protein n=1 Tax=Occultella gossypii TaxID=2800820 RepID=A0ABS7S6L1_9MICO|nr:hypothetical protein [Occultella gossypii]MBZ2195977.1 hypothetical protein [Occultella gossypii]
MSSSDPVLVARNRLAGLFANPSRTPDPEAVAAARRNLTAAHVRRAICKALTADPPLTSKQRAELAELLYGGAE